MPNTTLNSLNANMDATCAPHSALLVANHFHARIHDLLARVQVRQVYRNDESTNIEAVYTFALPQDAVVLNATIRIGGRELKARVIEKQQAQRRYEDALQDGDTPVLLELTEAGLFTLNLGNLMPGETAEIAFEYAWLGAWERNTFRFAMPLATAPRYGNPLQAGLQPHQVPVNSFDARLDATVAVEVTGCLARTRVECPGHAVQVARDGGATRITLSGETIAMDRDFVLNFTAADEIPAGAVTDRDGDRHVVLASFRPDFRQDVSRNPLNLTMVIDCSGSMQGDSIRSARGAVLGILDQLGPQDLFNVVLFGSHHTALFGSQVPAVGENLAIARQRLASLAANMGGTEMESALRYAMGLMAPAHSMDYRGAAYATQTLLLITDGEIWSGEAVTDAARGAGKRVFAIGVGTAVNAAFLKRLARRTGGACDLVSPNEDMRGAVARQFQRMRFVRPQSVEVVWPQTPLWSDVEALAQVFDQDTVHVFATFDSLPAGPVTLRCTAPDGAVWTQTVMPAERNESAAAGDYTTLARMAAQARLSDLSGTERTTTAVAYQLLSESTSYLAVDVRADKAADLPALRTVEQMLPAGWQGLGSVRAHAALSGATLNLAAASPATAMTAAVSFSAGASLNAGQDSWHSPQVAGAMDTFAGLAPDTLSMTMHSPRRSHQWISAPRLPMQPTVAWNGVGSAPPVADWAAIVQALDGLHPGAGAPRLAIIHLDALARLGLPPAVMDQLRDRVRNGTPEAHVLAAFLKALAESAWGAQMGRGLKRVIERAWHDSGQQDQALPEWSQSILWSGWPAQTGYVAGLGG